MTMADSMMMALKNQAPMADDRPRCSGGIISIIRMSKVAPTSQKMNQSTTMTAMGTAPPANGMSMMMAAITAKEAMTKGRRRP